MSDKFIKRLLYSVVAFLCIFTVGSFVIQYYKNQFDVLMSIYVVSTFAIAILTIAYVLTSHSQVGVMKEQLKEIRVSRELESQPLPVLIMKEIKLEKPRVFYSPPEKEYSSQSRYFAPFHLENKGRYPAVNVDCTGYLHIKKEKTPLVLSTVSEHFPVLAEGSTSKEEEFMFVNDSSAKLLNSILYDNVKDLPVIVVYTHYRNIIGGCFRQVQAFRVMSNSDNADKLKNWLTTINSFGLLYKSELDKIKKLFPYDDDKWHEQFDHIKLDFEKRIVDVNLNITLVPLPGSFEVKHLEREEYERAREEICYGTAIPLDLEECIHEN